MGLKFFSGVRPHGHAHRLGEPGPHRFQVIGVRQVGPHVVALVSYPDATEYHGHRVLLYRDARANEIRSATILDPHFLGSSDLPAPFARFESTQAGMDAARAFAKIL